MKLSMGDKLLLKLHQKANLWQEKLAQKKKKDLDDQKNVKNSAEIKKRKSLFNIFLFVILAGLLGIHVYISNSIRLINDTINTLPKNTTIEYRNELDVLKQTELFKAEVFSLVFFLILVVLSILFIYYLERKGFLAYHEGKIANAVDTAKNTILDTTEKVVSSVKGEEPNKNEIN